MSISRRLGILVVFGVPAIVGGGVVYAVFNGSYAALAVYEVLLLITAGGVISR